MKNIWRPLLSLSAPLLILLGVLGLFQRTGSDRLQSVPSLVVGSGLIISGALGRRRRRKSLLLALHKVNQKKD